jgi:hypothetical protein
MTDINYLASLENLRQAAERSCCCPPDFGEFNKIQKDYESLRKYILANKQQEVIKTPRKIEIFISK